MSSASISRSSWSSEARTGSCALRAIRSWRLGRRGRPEPGRAGRRAGCEARAMRWRRTAAGSGRTLRVWRAGRRTCRRAPLARRRWPGRARAARAGWFRERIVTTSVACCGAAGSAPGELVSNIALRASISAPGPVQQPHPRTPARTPPACRLGRLLGHGGSGAHRACPCEHRSALVHHLCTGTGPTACCSDWQALLADWNAGVLSSNLLRSNAPCPFGSGKLGKPCERMQ